MEAIILVVLPMAVLFLVASYIVLGRVVSFFVMRKAVENERALQMGLMRSLSQVGFLQGDLDGKIRQLEELTGKLEFSNQDLARLNEMKSKFLSMVVHDLRAPLASVKGFNALMMAGTKDERQKKMLSSMERAVEQMTHLIADLTDLAMIEAGKLRMEKSDFDIAMLVNEMSPALAINAQKRDIAFVSPELPPGIIVFGDKHRLGQVFGNLVSNAIKFNPPGGTIEILFDFDGSMAKVTVKDNGPGISYDERKKIFEKFYQSKYQKNKSLKQGWGLGLSIAREVVEAHKGQIGVDSPGLGKGSSFWFRIPAQSRQ